MHVNAWACDECVCTTIECNIFHFAFRFFFVCLRRCLRASVHHHRHHQSGYNCIHMQHTDRHRCALLRCFRTRVENSFIFRFEFSMPTNSWHSSRTVRPRRRKQHDRKRHREDEWKRYHGAQNNRLLYQYTARPSRCTRSDIVQWARMQRVTNMFGTVNWEERQTLTAKGDDADDDGDDDDEGKTPMVFHWNYPRSEPNRTSEEWNKSIRSDSFYSVRAVRVMQAKKASTKWTTTTMTKNRP